jgi:hypothetical protein
VTDFFKSSQINFVKIRPVGAELFHAEGQTDRQIDRQIDRQTKLIVAFRGAARLCRVEVVWPVPGLK